MTAGWSPSARHGNTAGMTTYEKIAISLPSRAAETIRRAVKHGRAKSVSAYIAAAVEEKTTKESFMELLEQMLEETGGPLTPAERRRADRELGYVAPALSPGRIPRARTKRRPRTASGTRAR